MNTRAPTEAEILYRTKCNKRDDEIFERYLAGETYAAIGRSYGRSRARIRQIVVKRLWCEARGL
jgi:Mor family transcriptional regulator